VTGLARGGALIETALTLGVVLMLLLGTFQFGALGVKQIAQDGAAFVAARTYAQSPASGVTRATGAASGAFGSVPQSGIVVTPASGTVTATIASAMQTPSIPGSPPTISLRSGATERIAPLATSPGAFSATNVLSNFRDASGVPLATHALSVAQPGLPSGGCDQTGGNAGCDGNHQHVDYGGFGTAAEWNCRLAAYALAFPSQRPKGAGTGTHSVWDPASSTSPLYAIYQWDTGTGCA
jgi:Flp pilus assembly protein TadG